MIESLKNKNSEFIIDILFLESYCSIYSKNYKDDNSKIKDSLNESLCKSEHYQKLIKKYNLSSMANLRNFIVSLRNLLTHGPSKRNINYFLFNFLRLISNEFWDGQIAIEENEFVEEDSLEVLLSEWYDDELICDKTYFLIYDFTEKISDALGKMFYINGINDFHNGVISFFEEVEEMFNIGFFAEFKILVKKYARL